MYVARRCSAPLNRLTVSNELTELPLQFFSPLPQTDVNSVLRFVLKQSLKVEAVMTTSVFSYRQLTSGSDACCDC